TNPENQIITHHGLKSFELSEVKQNANIVIDKDYYLKNQLLPICSRICAPLNQILHQQILSALGYNTVDQNNERNNNLHKRTDTNNKNTLNNGNSIRNMNCFSIIIQCWKCEKETNVLPDKYFS
ncbi:MAG: DNA polymerase alpha catalytic subunit, partial [Paramarteilia canceri]